MAKNYQPEKRADMAAEAWRLRTQKGWTEARIAEHLGCSQPTVSRYLNATRDAAQKRLEDNAVHYLGDQFDRLDAAIEQAWYGWERSLEDAVTVKVAETADGVFTTNTARGQAGDPRFLAEIRSLLQQQREVLGFTRKADDSDQRGKIDPETFRRATEQLERDGPGEGLPGDEG